MHNVLVISDLHLGEDLRPGHGEHEGHLDLGAIEAELVSFLDHYAAHRRDDRPWRLVINGDMVDFLSVWILPADAHLPLGLHPDDHHYGLGTRENAAVHKIEKVIARHAVFFAALARFLDAGNDLRIVIGNHDAEFHWPAVQRAFELGISLHSQRTLDAITADIEWHAWFYFEPDLVWVEHGHQYDGYCSFDTLLDPRDHTDERDLEQNVGSAVMRYVANFLPADLGENADQGFVHYVGLLRSDRGRALLSGYFWMVHRLFGQWASRKWNAESLEARHQRNRERMRALAIKAGLKDETLERLFRMRTTPVFTDFMRLVRAVMMGRLVVTLGTAFAFPIVAWYFHTFGIAALGVFFVLAHWWLARHRDVVDPRPAMREAAQRIRDLVPRAPVVVFGHTHYAAAHRLRGGGWYFNTGTWITEPDKVRSFTHLLIERKNGVRAALCRWREGSSRELRAEFARAR